MKSIKIIAVFLSCILLYASSCKKTNNNPPTDQLPPITQTGANTFGCLVNGNVWLPKGYDGRFINSRIDIDPTYSNGNLLIKIYKIVDDIREDFSLSSDSIKTVGTYKIGDNEKATSAYFKTKISTSTLLCSVEYGLHYQRSGYLKITKYDLQNGIFSGEFEITFNNTACGLGDPVKITQGRFDYKL